MLVTNDRNYSYKWHNCKRLLVHVAYISSKPGIDNYSISLSFVIIILCLTKAFITLFIFSFVCKKYLIYNWKQNSTTIHDKKIGTIEQKSWMPKCNTHSPLNILCTTQLKNVMPMPIFSPVKQILTCISVLLLPKNKQNLLKQKGKFIC